MDNMLNYIKSLYTNNGKTVLSGDPLSINLYCKVCNTIMYFNDIFDIKVIYFALSNIVGRIIIFQNHRIWKCNFVYKI